MEPNYLKQTYFFLKANLSMLVSIQLPFILLLIFIKQMLVADFEEGADLQRSLFLLTGLDLLFVPIYLGATLLFMQSVIDGKPLTVFQSWYMAMRSWGRLFLTFMLSALAISVGLMLLLVPGVYVGVRLVLANAICVLEGKGPMESIQTSWTTTAPHFWLLFKGLALIYGAIFVTELLIAPVLSDSTLGSILAQILLDFFNVFGTIFAFRVYRAWRDGELAKYAEE